MLILLPLGVYAADFGKVIVVYNPDKTVSVIHPMTKARIKGESVNTFLERVYQETVKDTELEGRPYDIIDKSELPDREGRDSWEGEKGEGITVNTIKKAKKEKDKLRKSLIDERAEKKAKEAAEAELIAEGIIEEE